MKALGDLGVLIQSVNNSCVVERMLILPTWLERLMAMHKDGRLVRSDGQLGFAGVNIT